MEKRVTVVCGHYGSGKTEFSINYAIHLAAKHKKTALVDLDIANPYFRSRQARALLSDRGIDVYSNTFGYDITADLPAITAKIRAPLESEDTFTVVDVGGDATGAMVLNQFRKYFLKDDAAVSCVINANRPETRETAGAAAHMAAIEAETGLTISAIINNTHLLKETTCETILEGMAFAEKLSKERQIPILFHTCPRELLPAVLKQKEGAGIGSALFPIHLYMRPTWIDR